MPAGGCEIALCVENMNEVKELSIWGCFFSKFEGMEGEITEKVVKGRSVEETLARVMKREEDVQ